jgi:hypothetical protein
MFATISLVLFLATIALWVRTRHAHDVVSYRFHEGMATHSVDCRLHPGALSFGHGLALHDLPVGFQYDDYRKAPGDPLLSRRTQAMFGFHIGYGESRWWRDVMWIRIPLWFFLLLTCIAPLLWLDRRRFRTFPPGCCRNCGYDLRATPQRCPECGAVPTKSSQLPLATP